MEKSNFLQKIPLESGLTTHFGYMGVHIEKPHGHFFCTSYYPKYRHLDQCGVRSNAAALTVHSYIPDEY